MGADCSGGMFTDRQIDRQTDRQTNKQTDILITILHDSTV